jgi:hypothetical protein
MRAIRILIVIGILITASWGFALSEELERERTGRTFGEKFRPRFGAVVGLMLPVGDVGSVMKAGFGVRAFGDLSIPIAFLNENGLVLRTGLQFGYAAASSENTGFDAKVGMLPIVAYADLGYPLRFGLTPSFRIGFGGTSVSLKDQSGGGNDTSSFDATLEIGAALGYRPFERVEFLLSTGYAILFEEVNGSFVYLSIGAAYHL